MSDTFKDPYSGQIIGGGTNTRSVGAKVSPSVFNKGLGSVPTQGTNTPNRFEAGVNKNLGTSFGFATGMQDNNTFGYVENGKQMYTGDLSNNPEATKYLQESPNGQNLDGSNISSGLNTAMNGVQALTGVANAYLGYKNYGLAKEKFAAEKATTNADYIAQAMGYNTGLQNSQDVGLALGGSAMTQDQITASQNYINSRKLSENKIV